MSRKRQAGLKCSHVQQLRERQNVTNSAMIYERAEHSRCELRSLLASTIRLVSYDAQVERACPLMIAQQRTRGIGYHASTAVRNNCNMNGRKRPDAPKVWDEATATRMHLCHIRGHGAIYASRCTYPPPGSSPHLVELNTKQRHVNAYGIRHRITGFYNSLIIAHATDAPSLVACRRYLYWCTVV